MQPSKKFTFTVAALALLATLCAARPAYAQDGEDYERVMEMRADTLVTVKFVLRIAGGFGEEEQESETTGVLVSDDGLVLCSNAQIGGFAGLWRAMGRPVDFTVTPTNVKVLVGDDHEGVEARVVARDSELDLAWVRIGEPREGGYPFIDLNDIPEREARAGDVLLSVSRLAEFFGRAPVVSEGRVSGVTTKPRRLIVPSASLGSEPGDPVFGAGGEFVGFVVIVAPEEEDVAADVSMEKRQEMIGVFALPAGVVASATRRAIETEGQ